jgi:hypothetical protein
VTFTPWIEMLGNDDRRRKIGGERGNQRHQRTDTAGRRSDDDQLHLALVIACPRRLSLGASSWGKNGKNCARG